MTERQKETLAAEARAFHLAFFGKAAAQDLVDRYAAANLHCFGTATDDSVSETVVRNRLDAEAVEIVVRGRRECRLSTKIQILFYLAEAQRETREAFVAREESFVFAAVALAAALLRSGWKWVKGQYLVRRHGLV
jgi:hypothetical protein